MTYPIIPDSEALAHCAVCRRHISPDAEVFSAGVTLKAHVDVSEYERHCVQIGQTAHGDPIGMMVTAAGSDARKEGLDGLLLCCSPSCGRELKRVLEDDPVAAERIEAIHLESA